MQRKREIVQQHNRNQEYVVDSSGYERAQVKPQNRLNVRLNFHNRANGPRMRVAKELRKTKQELNALKETHETLKRKFKSTLRSIQRTNMKIDKKADTPNFKAKRLAKKLNLKSKVHAFEKSWYLLTRCAMKKVQIATEVWRQHMHGS